MTFDEWEGMIVKAYEQAPRSYQDAYRKYVSERSPDADQASAFHAGWHAACNALANRLVEWLDEPAGDDVSAFLGFVEELRRGDLS